VSSDKYDSYYKDICKYYKKRICLNITNSNNTSLNTKNTIVYNNFSNTLNVHAEEFNANNITNNKIKFNKKNNNGGGVFYNKKQKFH